VKSKLQFHDDLPTQAKIQDALSVSRLLCVYDQVLLGFPELASWLGQFDHGFSVIAGEDLKDLRHFPKIAEQVLSAAAGVGPKDLGIVAVGGGSVGDSIGFLASVLKRGVPFFSIPSTWLAAMDSAHGGKTALNAGPFKNQIGSFYPAKQIWISRRLLATQTDEQRDAAFGELAKMAMIAGGDLFRNLESASEIDDLRVWSLLPKVIQQKNKIVRQDPFEAKGIRSILNLGHTVGHALELFHRLPHGEAVRLGLWFSVDWSFQLGLMKRADHQRCEKVLRERPRPEFRISKAQLLDALKHDKKLLDEGEISFVFLEKPGRPVTKRVALNDLAVEAGRQGWLV